MSTAERTRTGLGEADEHDSEVDSSVRLRQSAETVWSYTPFNETEQINLTLSRARHYLATPTKSGKLPSDRDLTNFLQVCKIRRLNPWVRDAFILGYDTKDGAKFDTIVAYQALAKRAEANDNYDGMECGIIVTTHEGKTTEMEGAFSLKDEELVGAWARVYRKDRSKPTTAKISRSQYDKRFGRWEVDPHGMLVKCAKSAAMREAFPSDLGGLYTEDEISDDALSGSEVPQPADDLKTLPDAYKEHPTADTYEESQSTPDADYFEMSDQLIDELDNATDLTEVGAIRDLTLDQYDGTAQKLFVNSVCDVRVKQIKAGRGERSNETQEPETEST